MIIICAKNYFAGRLPHPITAEKTLPEAYKKYEYFGIYGVYYNCGLLR
jgi:hypothetical protein